MPADEARGGTLIQADLGSADLFNAVTETGDPLLDGSGVLIGVAPAAGRSPVTPAGLVEFLAIGPLLDRLGADPAAAVQPPAPSKPGKSRRNGPPDPWWEDETTDGEMPDGELLDGDIAPPT